MMHIVTKPERAVSPTAAAAFVLVATAGTPPSATGSHLAEIKVFASTMAIVRIAHDECPGTTINEAYLEDMRQRLHMVRADQPDFVQEAHAVVDALHKGLSEAASREVWCATVFRLYGPDGKMIRGLLNR